MEADFSTVWSRVIGSASQETPDVQLRRFLLSETEDVCLLRTILSKTCDTILCRKLSQVYTEKARQLKRLRTALYLLAGECKCPDASPTACPPELLPALKSLYERVCAEAAAYRKAAAEADRAALKTVYTALAEAETRHAMCLMECVERLLCLSGWKAPL